LAGTARFRGVETQKRIPKLSAAYFREAVAGNAVV
jgi:hypothetical protein